MYNQSVSDKFQLIIARLKSSLSIKMLALLFVCLFLQIPILIISSLKDDRASTQRSVVHEITEKWGEAQTICGPAIQLTKKKKREISYKDIGKEYTEFYEVETFSLPIKFDAKAELQPEMRYRGIYQAVLYSAETGFSGSFNKIDDKDIVDSKLAFSLSQLHGLKSVSGKIHYHAKDNSKHTQELEFSALKKGGSDFLLANLANNIDYSQPIDFDIKLSFNSSQSLNFTPVGKENNISVSAKWNSPSFTGNFLPTNREITDKEFSANWKISDFNTGIPRSVSRLSDASAGNKFGVDLFISSNVYQQVERLLKYSFIFIAILAMSLLVAEKIFKIRLRLIQYVLTMASPISFYLLLLALGEHLGFGPSYIICALLITLMTSAYCKALFENTKIALGFAAVSVLTFLLMFVILSAESYALLLGSFMVFAMLGTLMALTANLNKRDQNKEKLLE